MDGTRRSPVSAWRAAILCGLIALVGCEHKAQNDSTTSAANSDQNGVIDVFVFSGVQDGEWNPTPNIWIDVWKDIWIDWWGNGGYATDSGTGENGGTSVSVPPGAYHISINNPWYASAYYVQVGPDGEWVADDTTAEVTIEGPMVEKVVTFFRKDSCYEGVVSCSQDKRAIQKCLNGELWNVEDCSAKVATPNPLTLAQCTSAADGAPSCE